MNACYTPSNVYLCLAVCIIVLVDCQYSKIPTNYTEPNDYCEDEVTRGVDCIIKCFNCNCNKAWFLFVRVAREFDMSMRQPCAGYEK